VHEATAELETLEDKLLVLVEVDEVFELEMTDEDLELEEVELLLEDVTDEVARVLLVLDEDKVGTEDDEPHRDAVATAIPT
jgi:hypothetical protein